MVSGPWLSSLETMTGPVEWVGQPLSSAVCNGQRERRSPTTHGGAWPAEGCCAQGPQLRSQPGTDVRAEPSTNASPGSTSGMSAVIAAQGGRALGGSHEPGPVPVPAAAGRR